ncbi:LacI family DNA-binding transcriptional regulator [Anaerobium acetethylicum]|uniref:Ribose transport system substrate-binding protein n=1 Tax=Anaerobium acetethylicum TaxID=1619234 RepID=A0A1D3TXC8_9FIRM|nr:LacI family DNA-binding transcriptional regulator [Anaerobium acetethylicum]SCP98948.1 ribose transport system substrate-binding protein [Anaerobium acetethylicum]
MKVTIKEVAKIAGVSIATVSHVINKTRYVGPELTEKVKSAIEETGYKIKTVESENNLRIGKESIIAFVIPNIGGTVYSQLISVLSVYLAREGYVLSVFLTGDDIESEKCILSTIMADKRIAGVFIAPVSSSVQDYKKLLSENTPVVFLERSIKNFEVCSVLSENELAIYKGMKHLIKCGHEKIAIILESRNLTTVEERLSGYRKALENEGIRFDENLVIKLDLYDREEVCRNKINAAFELNKPTAFIAGGNRLTLLLLRTIQNMGLECPNDISVVGFGDEEWCELAAPPLTTLKQNTEEMGKSAAELIISLINGETVEQKEIRVPANLSIRKSVQIIGRGPFGENATAPEEIELTEEEIKLLKESDFKVGISFHYGGTAWARLHENGIRDTLSKYGITVISVTDAHFNPELQVRQLEGLRIQEPNAIVAIPTDDEVTSNKFRELARETKLVFISNIPKGMKKDEYASCVSVNERENGHNAAVLIGEHFKNEKHIKLGFIGHGAPFYGTHLRDMIAEQTILENYPNIEIVDTQYFYQIDNAFDVCKKMIMEHPDIQGLYVSWDRPALEVIRALEEMERTDVAIVTFELDTEIASYLAQEKMVVGVSTQLPYEQGVAVALVTAKALLNKCYDKYIGVHPYTVKTNNLLRAWREVNHEKAPEEIEQYITRKFT